MPHSLKERLKRLFSGSEGEIYHLEHVIDKSGYKEAWMNAEEFDRVTEDVIVVEIGGQRIGFLNTPVIPFMIYRKDDAQC
jgi:hypothetical protein